jgi:hypothetical protein
MNWPPHIKFFIDNHKDIAGVVELDRRVREELPAKIAKILLVAVVDDFEQNPWGLSTLRKRKTEMR